MATAIKIPKRNPNMRIVETMRGYPKKAYGQFKYVLHPEIVTANSPTAPAHIKIGAWVAVEVLPVGFKHQAHPTPFKTREECQKACDIANKAHGFTQEFIIKLLDKSMGIKPEPKAPRSKWTRTPYVLHYLNEQVYWRLERDYRLMEVSASQLATDKMFLQEIINSLRKTYGDNVLSTGTKHGTMLRDWVREMRTKTGIKGKTKRFHALLCGAQNYQPSN